MTERINWTLCLDGGTILYLEYHSINLLQYKRYGIVMETGCRNRIGEQL